MRSRSPCSTRPTTWPTSASCRASPRSSTPPRPTASHCCSRPPSTAASIGSCALPGQSGDPRGRRDVGAGRVDGPPGVRRPARGQAGDRRRDRRPSCPHAVLRPHQARRRPVGQATHPIGASNATAIHGNLNQNQRLRALDAFTSGRSRVLVATDVAARGLHVDDLDLVVHYDPPNDHKDYLHRSGRTARAGASGTVVSFVEPGQARDVARMQAVVSVHPEVVSVESGHRAVRELAESGEIIDIIAGPPARIPSRSPQAPRGPRAPRTGYSSQSGRSGRPSQPGATRHRPGARDGRPRSAHTPV